jgi:putative ABC transport system substrate-binding protein
MIGMRRREFLTFVGSAATASISWPLIARAQQAVRMRRIGILLYSKQELANVIPMLRGLEALGYVDGKTISVEYRDAEGQAAASDLISVEDVGRIEIGPALEG